MRRQRSDGRMTIVAAIFVASSMLGGCVSEVQPTIAHTHIGHAITGWHDTPGKQGLLALAREEANIALEHAGYAVAEGNEVALVKEHTTHVVHALDPSRVKIGPGRGYGMIAALEGARDHMGYAGTSDDASGNIQAFVPAFETGANQILQRAELILALAGDIAAAADLAEALALGDEVFALAEANVLGEDANGDGQIGFDTAETGLQPLNQALNQMTAREQPPYQPVATKYLLGLVPMSDGSRKFKLDKYGTTGNSGY